MPTQLESVLLAGFLMMQAQAPCVVTGNGHTVIGVCSPISTDKLTQDQGFLAVADGIVVLKNEDAVLVNAVLQSPLTVDGKSVRVVKVDESATDPTREIHFKHAR